MNQKISTTAFTRLHDFPVCIHAAISIFLCVTSAQATDRPTTRPEGESKFVHAFNRFAVDLFKGTVQNHHKAGSDNVVISPYCTEYSLAILHDAAAGKTKESLQKLLGLSGNEKADHAMIRESNDFLTGRNATGKSLICNVANKFWFDRGAHPNPSFFSDIETHLRVESGTGDFAGAPESVSKEINQWVSNKTNGKINDLCKTTSLLGKQADLISAIYFHGQWIHPFEPDLTHDTDFHSSSTTKSVVKMMRRSAVSDYYHGDGITLTEIPYYTNEPYEKVAFCQFMIILPDDPEGLEKLEKKLDLDTLEKWIRASHESAAQMDDFFKTRPGVDATEEQFKEWAARNPVKQVQLDLPRFSIETRCKLGEAMKAAGASEVFGQHADFSRMGVAGFHVDDLLQVARIDVDEKGTEAAAAQEYGLFGGSSGAPISVTVDHPFLYVIRESTTGMILFIGHVGDPAKR